MTSPHVRTYAKTRKLLRAAPYLALFACLAIGSTLARAETKSVAEEILDLLKANGQIGDEQYEALTQKAREENARRSEQPLPAVSSAGPEDYEVYWDNSLHINRNDKQVQLQIGGRIQNDWAAFDTDSRIKSGFGNADSGTEIRRARLYFSGTLYERVIFKAQLGFDDGDVDFRDFYIGLTDLPYVGTFKVGHFKEPFSLDAMTSSKYITFMERGLSQVFFPGRNSGFGIGKPELDERMTWAAAAFRETDDFANDVGNDGSWHLTGRVTGLPVYEENGSKLVHLGVSYSHQFSHKSDFSYSQRPAAHLAPIIWDTLSLSADDVDLLGTELAVIHGPFSFQSEYMHSFMDTSMGDRNFWGAYGQVSYFLTGEQRNYDTEGGVFARVSPHRNFNPSAGAWGAFELAVRYSHLDLNDGAIQGGVGNEVTAGLNWYLFPALRWTGNYLWAHRAHFGDINGWEMRFQLEF